MFRSSNIVKVDDFLNFFQKKIVILKRKNFYDQKEKTSVEQDEPEYKLGISVKVEGEDSTDEGG